jgi:hypothetical protein
MDSFGLGYWICDPIKDIRCSKTPEISYSLMIFLLLPKEVSAMGGG